MIVATCLIHNITQLIFILQVGKKNEDGPFFIDRITNHPILQLLNLRRKSKTSKNASNQTCNQKTKEEILSQSTFYAPTPSTSSDPKLRVSNEYLIKIIRST